MLPENIFPSLFRNTAMGQDLNENRNLVQLSYHLDNWISLSAGMIAFEFLSKHAEKLSEDNHKKFWEQFYSEHSQDFPKDQENLIRIYEINSALELNIKSYSLHKCGFIAIGDT